MKSERNIGDSDKALSLTFKDLFDNSVDAIFIHDLDSKFIAVNNVACKRLGYSEKEFLEMKPSDIDPTDNARPGIGRPKVRNEDGSLDFDTLLVTKDGLELPTSIHSSMLEIDGKKMALTIARDMTKWKKAEAKLEEKTMFLETVINTASDGIFILDERPNYILINPACGRIVNLDPKEHIGKRAGLSVHPDDFEKALSHFMRSMNGEATNFEGRIQDANGSYRNLDIHLTPISYLGKRHILGVVTDITDRKKEEEMKRIKALDEVKGFLVSAFPIFASVVSSEARNIIVAHFADRFEKNLRPRFEIENPKNLRQSDVDGPIFGRKAIMGSYLEWLRKFFTNLGATIEVHILEDEGTISLKGCPWHDLSKGNPIFCLLCRTMVIRSHSWTELGGTVTQLASMAGGEESCVFVL